MSGSRMKKKKTSLIGRLFGFIGRLLLAMLILLVAACAAAAALYAYAASIAPPISEAIVSPHGFRSSVLDREGNELLFLAGEESNRVYVHLNEIPKALQQAVIAIEDERFYSHPGIDPYGIARALWKDITTGTLAQGASTITQQLIKNNVFSALPESTSREKIERKLAEQYLALRLERLYSKDWILEKYLNTINLGAGTWGVQTAAQRYFSKDVSELTLSESAVIAAITRSPMYYNPLKYPERNRERQLQVLANMHDLGMLSDSEYAQAVQEDPYANLKEGGWEAEIPVFSWFADAALTQVAHDLSTARKIPESQAWDMLYHDGLTIETTQDTTLQRICEEEANRGEYDDGFQATVVLMDPYNGQVKAIVGGRGEKTASLTWNRAISSPRQPGSTVKVTGEYAVALELGKATLGTIYEDAPTSYTGGGAIRNADGIYHGRMTLRDAVAQSTNTVALRCFQQVGVRQVWEQLNQFGFKHLDLDQDYTEALALGGTYGGVTNLELTAAYAAIANGGLYTQPVWYTRVLDVDGNVILKTEPEQRRVLGTYTSALLTMALEQVMKTGTGTEAAFAGPALAGKSGTTTDRKDLWFVGYSTSCVCGVWNGYDTPAAQSDSSGAKKMWRAVMSRVHETLPGGDVFPTPDEFNREWICTKSGKLAVNGICNHTVQGDMTRMEAFAPGTSPTEYCDCHTAIEFCTESHEHAGEECPSTFTEVYLTQAVPGTEEEKFVIPVVPDCSIHLNWLEWSRSRRNDPDWRLRDNGSTPSWDDYF